MIHMQIKQTNKHKSSNFSLHMKMVQIRIEHIIFSLILLYIKNNPVSQSVQCECFSQFGLRLRELVSCVNE